MLYPINIWQMSMFLIVCQTILGISALYPCNVRNKADNCSLNLSFMSKENYFNQAITWVKRKAHLSIQANYEGYESPKSFKNVATETRICPDITFVGPQGYENYTEIAIKEADHRDVVTRWKLISSLATVKNGKFYILAPRGHRSFAQDLVDSFSINAKVVSI